MTRDPRFYQRPRVRTCPPPKDEIEAIARRAWHREGAVLGYPDKIEAAGDWVTAQTMRAWAEKQWGRRGG